MAKTVTMTIDGVTAEYIKSSDIEATKVICKDAKHEYFPIGKQVSIRTVTMIYVGTLIDVTENDFILTKAAWIADTGRWNQYCAKGSASEVEPYPSEYIVTVNRSAYLDLFEIDGDFSKVK